MLLLCRIYFFTFCQIRIEGDINDAADMLGGSTGDMITSGLSNATIGDVTIEEPVVNVEEPTIRKCTLFPSIVSIVVWLFSIFWEKISTIVALKNCPTHMLSMIGF